METEKYAIDVAEMAKLLGISKPTAYALTKREDFPAIHVSEKRIIIPVDALKKWLDKAGFWAGFCERA